MGKDKLKAGDGEQGTGSNAGALATTPAESGLPGEGAAVATEAGGVVDAPGDGVLASEQLAVADDSDEIPRDAGETTGAQDAVPPVGVADDEGLHQTSDGETFALEYHARSHARSLKDHTVTRVKRTA